MYIPWIEKYKPTSFEEFEDYSIKTFNVDNFNNLILYGKSGVGKTSFLDVLIRESGTNKKYILSLNASDERGITTVRDKIKNFCKQVYSGKKLIILDEADNLTYEAQTALRRIIEVHSKNTRFCFICNYISKIIDPIKSRCNIYNFKKYSKNFIYHNLISVLKKENVDEKYVEILDKIIEVADGDIRKSIIYLEIFCKIPIDILRNFNLKSLIGEIDCEKLIELINEKDFEKVVSFLKNYSYNQIQTALFQIILQQQEVNQELFLLLSDFDKHKNYKIDLYVFLLKFFSIYDIDII